MRDYQQEITDGIIAAIEKGVAPWQRPWNAVENTLPYNATTEKSYQGGNVIWLLTVAATKGYSDPRWCTYKQAQEHGWQVRKGEHGTGIVYWKRTEQVKEIDPETGQEVKKEVPLIRPIAFHAVVFNAQQIDRIPTLEPKAMPTAQWKPIDRAEVLLWSSGAIILHDGGNKAYYHPVTDDIHLPVRAAFPGPAAYYDTALHELAHWTGHQSRLNRQVGVFGTMEYAREELRAEIASFFASVETGLPHDPARHASYVHSWVQVLKQDKHEIFRAARDAVKIVDYLLLLEQQQKPEQDRHRQRDREDKRVPAMAPPATRTRPKQVSKQIRQVQEEMEL